MRKAREIFSYRYNQEMAEDDKEAHMMEAMGLPVKFCSNFKKEEMLKAEAVRGVQPGAELPGHP